MKPYKQTSEYAFDVLDHFYRIHENQILSLGKDNIRILLPTEIHELLKDRNGNLITQFRKIDLLSYNGSMVIFALKEIK